MEKSKIKSIILPDRDGGGYYVTVGEPVRYKTGFTYSKIDGGSVVEYEDHWEREWVRVYCKYDHKNKTDNVGVVDDEFLIAQYNPNYIESIHYFIEGK